LNVGLLWAALGLRDRNADHDQQGADDDQPAGDAGEDQPGETSGGRRLEVGEERQLAGKRKAVPTR
jgi:hypothetical protein